MGSRIEKNDIALTEGQLPEQKLVPFREVILYIWWDKKDVVYYKLLPRSLIITAEVYCQELRLVV